MEDSLALALHQSRQVIGTLFLLTLAIQARTPISAGHELDFWTGDWKVYVNGKLNGKDSVVKSLNGFAVTEQWKGVENGDVGTSLFYYMPAKKQWKQVWVTGIGVYKEKYSEPFAGGIRFSGKTFFPRGKTLSDRTTLTRLPDGTVRQVIEQSREGMKWVVGFDAIYKHA